MAYERDNKERMGRVFVEIEGEPIDITDLKKEDYEEFLKRMKSLDFMYNVLQNPRGDE